MNITSLSIDDLLIESANSDYAQLNNERLNSTRLSAPTDLLYHARIQPDAKYIEPLSPSLFYSLILTLRCTLHEEYTSQLHMQQHNKDVLGLLQQQMDTGHPIHVTGGGGNRSGSTEANAIPDEDLDGPPNELPTPSCIEDSLAKFVDSMARLPLSLISHDLCPYRHRHFSYSNHSCHVHTMLESLFAIIENSPSPVFGDSSATSTAIRVCYSKWEEGAPLCDISDHFRVFFNGRNKNDTASVLGGYGCPGTHGAYIHNMRAVFNHLPSSSLQARSPHFGITRSSNYTCSSCHINRPVLTTQPAIFQLWSSSAQWWSPQEAVQKNTAFYKQSTVQCLFNSP